MTSDDLLDNIIISNLTDHLLKQSGLAYCNFHAEHVVTETYSTQFLSPAVYKISLFFHEISIFCKLLVNLLKRSLNDATS